MHTGKYLYEKQEGNRYTQRKAEQSVHAAKRRQEKLLLKRVIFCFSAAFLSLLFSLNLSAVFAEANEIPYKITLKSNTDRTEEKYYKSIELSYGDTLWEIAEEYMDDSYDSIYEYIEELKTINGLTSERIHAGRYLTVVYSESYCRADTSDSRNNNINE